MKIPKIFLLLFFSSFLLGFKGHTGFVEQSWDQKQKVRIILIGDTGQLPVQNDPHKMNQQQREQLRNSLQKEQVDAIVDLGDLFYWKGPRCRPQDNPIDSGKMLDAHIYDYVGGLDIPVFLVLGNHDVGPLSEHFRRRFLGEQSGKSSESRERCYALQADVHDEIFFPNQSYGIDFGPLRMAVLHTSAPYRLWADAEIDSFFKEQPDDWTLLAGHHVLKTACDKEKENIVLPWLNEHDIQPDLYANGHAHILQFGIFEDILAITSGSGSKLRTPDCSPTDTEGVHWGAYQFGYAVLEVDASVMKLVFKGIDGSELFCWERQKDERYGRECLDN